VVADRGCDSDAFRTELCSRGIRSCIPFKSGRRPRPGPKPDFSARGRRWRIEHLFARLGYRRRLLIRWERSAQAFLAFPCRCLARALVYMERLSG